MRSPAPRQLQRGFTITTSHHRVAPGRQRRRGGRGRAAATRVGSVPLTAMTFVPTTSRAAPGGARQREGGSRAAARDRVRQRPGSARAARFTCLTAPLIRSRMHERAEARGPRSREAASAAAVPWGAPLAMHARSHAWVGRHGTGNPPSTSTAHEAVRVFDR